MKKLFVVFAVLALVLTSTINAQGFNENSKTLSFGIGLGGFAGLTGTSTLPPISVGAQFAVTDKISAGGIIGYAGSSQELWGGGKWKYSYILIGARGEYHFMKPEDKLDLYAGITLGYNIVSSSWEGSGLSLSDASGSELLYGAHLGAKYAISDKFGVYGELGYGIGVLNLGAFINL